jgi:hypothetical protein
LAPADPAAKAVLPQVEIFHQMAATLFLAQLQRRAEVRVDRGTVSLIQSPEAVPVPSVVHRVVMHMMQIQTLDKLPAAALLLEQRLLEIREEAQQEAHTALAAVVVVRLALEETQDVQP